MPGIAFIIGVESFKETLLENLITLSKDPSEQVRRKIAVSIHEISKVFAEKEDIKSLEKIIFPLLKDDSMLVLQGLFTNIQIIPQLYEQIASNQLTKTPSSKRTFDLNKFIFQFVDNWMQISPKVLKSW